MSTNEKPFISPRNAAPTEKRQGVQTSFLLPNNQTQCPKIAVRFCVPGRSNENYKAEFPMEVDQPFANLHGQSSVFEMLVDSLNTQKRISVREENATSVVSVWIRVGVI
jgi:hypothetical protein